MHPGETHQKVIYFDNFSTIFTRSLRTLQSSIKIHIDLYYDSVFNQIRELSQTDPECPEAPIEIIEKLVFYGLTRVHPTKFEPFSANKIWMAFFSIEMKIASDAAAYDP